MALNPVTGATSIWEETALRRSPFVVAVPGVTLLLSVALHAGGSTIGAGDLLREDRGSPRASAPAEPDAVSYRAPTALPVASDDPGEPAASIDINQDTSLEALLPDELRGISLFKVSVAGAAFEADASTSGLLERVGASPEDASAAFAVDPSGRLNGQVVALRVAGADTDRLRDEYRAAVELLAGTELREETIGGRTVLTGQNPEDRTSAVYFYAREDVLFFVFTADPSLAAEALAVLP